MFRSKKKIAFAYIGRSKAVADRIARIASTESNSFEFLLLKAKGKWSADISKYGTVFVELSDAHDLERIENVLRQSVKGQRIIMVTEGLEQAEMRKLIRLGISDWLTPNASEQEVQSACVEDRTASREGARNIFTFTPVLGGMGATTLAIETALLVANKGRSPTCVVDLDFYAGECADYLNVDAKLLLDGLSASPEDIDEHFVNSVLSEHASGIKLLAAQTHLGANKHIRADVVLHMLNMISSRFDNVIIDLPRSWYEWTDEVVLGTDQLFLVTDASIPALRATKRQLAEYKQRYAGKVSPKVLVNKQQRSWFSGAISETDLRTSLEGNFHGSISDDTHVARQAINRGVPISNVKAQAKLVQDLRRLIEPILKT